MDNKLLTIAYCIFNVDDQSITKSKSNLNLTSNVKLAKTFTFQLQYIVSWYYFFRGPSNRSILFDCIHV